MDGTHLDCLLGWSKLVEKLADGRIWMEWLLVAKFADSSMANYMWANTV